MRNALKTDESIILSLHWKEKPTKTFPEQLWFVFSYDGAVQRALKHKGVDPVPIAHRQMTEDEVRHSRLAHPYVYAYHWYESWEILIENEINICRGQYTDWINNLFTLSELLQYRIRQAP